MISCRLSRVSVSARLDLRGLHFRRLPLYILAVETNEVDRIEHQWREAAVTDGRGNNLAREWEQQARALDHDQRMQVFLRYIDDPEYPGIGKIETEHNLAGVF